MITIEEYLAGLRIPPGWVVVQEGMDGRMWKHRATGMSVLASLNVEEDNKQWLHLSVAHPSRMPTYKNLAYLKRHWAGDDRKCIMVFPEASMHVNFHPYCLHLFSCMEGDPLPDFTWGMGMI